MAVIAEASEHAVEGTAASSSKSPGISVDEQLLKAEELKTQGNQAYERNELTEALKQWHHVSERLQIGSEAR